MPHEIPDSDEDSDYEFALQAAYLPPAPEHSQQHSPHTSDRRIDVNFDQFISQTQSAKEASSQLEQTKHSIASTQRHLREALDNQQGSASSSYDGADDAEQGFREAQLPMETVGQRKRAHSETDNGHDQRRPSQSRSKRTKTYGSSSRCLASTQDLERTKERFETVDRDQAAFPDAFAASFSSQAQQDSDEDDEIVPLERTRPGRLLSLFGGAVPNASNVLSTSKSSMGGYQSINLNFRGSGAGLDIHTNPFGALSQRSVDVDAERVGEERRAELSSTVPLSASPRRPHGDALSPLTDAGFEHQTTVYTTISTDPSVLTFGPPDGSQMLISPIATTEAQDSAFALTTASNQVMRSTQEVAGVASINASVDQIAPSAITKKENRRSKGSRQPSREEARDEVIHLHGPNDLAIGLPKEQYKPRSSKARGYTIDPEQQSQEDKIEPPTKKKGKDKSMKPTAKTSDQSSPAKLPTSELNLSDEAVIGLPKENYKPRPSRRRSRMIVDEDTSIEVATCDEPAQPEQSPHNQQSTTGELKIAPTPKQKKGKKAKVKRAKTSAAAWLKKSEPMISEGEEDVVWMDTKPAKVKLDIPADPLAGKEVKSEKNPEIEMAIEDEKSEKPVEESQQKENDVQLAPSKTVTVEIPARVDMGKAEPKKKGRKLKTVAADNDEADTPEANNEPTTSTRATDPPAFSPPRHDATSTILKEKDTNSSLRLPTPTKQTASSSPTKPAKITHSPINPTGGKGLYRVGLSRRSAIPPLLKIVKPPAKQQQQQEKENFDEDGKAIDLVAETMKKWREMGALD